MSWSNNYKHLPNSGKKVFVPDEPFKLDLRRSTDEGWEPIPEGTEERLLSAVYQAIGAASVCWTESPTGIFMAERAKQIAEAVVSEVREWHRINS